MICNKQIILQDLADQGKNFNWGKHFCENCNRFMWGHGFVSKYFSHSNQSIFVKRYRCPDCCVVVTIRPSGFWNYLRSSTLIIFITLRHRINQHHWPWYSTRQRAGHWLKRFVSFAKIEMVTNLGSFLDYCFNKGIRFFP
jgi:hypothetical protein